MSAPIWSSLVPFSSYPPHDLLCLTLLLVLLLSLYYYITRAGCRHGGRPLPPGSLGLPLGLGENLQFIFGNSGPLGSPRPFLSYRLQKYGTVFKTHLLGYPTVIAMDAEFNKLLISSEEKLVQAEYPNFMRKLVGGFIDAHGEIHMQLRELLLSGFGRVAIEKVHLVSIQEHICSFLHSWSSMGVLDAQQECKKLQFTYIFKFLLNLEPEDPDTLALMKDYELILQFQTSLPMDIPGFTFNKILKARKRIATKISELLNAQRKVMGTQCNHFMDVLMKERDKFDSSFNEKSIIDILFGVVIGAHETTSSILTHIIKFLTENPRVVDELRREHTSIAIEKKENELLNWDDFKQMHFTKNVIKETLRLTNVAEFVPRGAIQDIVYKGMVIPKGWRVLVNLSMLHLNPTSYENPLKFDPWRWQDTNTNNQGFFMPFGGGLRSCIGTLFAEVEISIFIHYLIMRYKVMLHRIPNNGGRHDVVSGHLISKMKNGLPIKVSPV